MPSARYQEAGVNLAAGDEVVRRAAACAAATRPLLAGHDARLLAAVGGFAAAVAIPRLRQPVLLAAADGVGTKIQLLQQAGRLRTAGVDLVAMCVNDLLCQGGAPLFFLDYYACGQLRPDSAAAFLAGVAAGCEQAQCALVGGETAEMPGVYPPDGLDAAGFAVGLCERENLLPVRDFHPGDNIIGLASSGPHANGFSLIRKILNAKAHSESASESKSESESESKSESASSVGVDAAALAESNPAAARWLDALLAPTRIYVRAVAALRAAAPVRAVAHITGGGVVDNLPRVLPNHFAAKIFRDAWARPAVFDFLKEAGRVDEDEMHRVFNCGVGMAVVVEKQCANQAVAVLREAGEDAFIMGELVARGGDDAGVVFA